MNSYLLPFAGGLLIGFSSLVMLTLLGRITGISGIFGNLVTGQPDRAWRFAFVAGLVLGPLIYHAISGTAAPAPSHAGWPLTVLAGLLVGFGTRYAGGCTSGHGVCGIGRLSPRSIAATATFMGAGFLTVYIMRHLIAG